MSFFESARTTPHVMEDIMCVDDTHTPSTGSAAGKRKRQPQAPNSPGTWQDLHAQERRLLDKIDRAQTEGEFDVLPHLQVVHSLQNYRTKLSKPPEYPYSSVCMNVNDRRRDFFKVGLFYFLFLNHFSTQEKLFF